MLEGAISGTTTDAAIEKVTYVNLPFSLATLIVPPKHSARTFEFVRPMPTPELTSKLFFSTMSTMWCLKIVNSDFWRSSLIP